MYVVGTQKNCLTLSSYNIHVCFALVENGKKKKNIFCGDSFSHICFNALVGERNFETNQVIVDKKI